LPAGDTRPLWMPWACRLPYAAAANLASVSVRLWLGPSALGGVCRWVGSLRRYAGAAQKHAPAQYRMNGYLVQVISPGVTLQVAPASMEPIAELSVISVPLRVKRVVTVEACSRPFWVYLINTLLVVITSVEAPKIVNVERISWANDGEKALTQSTTAKANFFTTNSPKLTVKNLLSPITTCQLN